MHILYSKSSHAFSTNICPYSNYLWLYKSHLIWDMLGHFMSKKRHHFYHFKIPFFACKFTFIAHIHAPLCRDAFHYYYHLTTTLLLP
ncbi:hypothetical protein PFAG_06134 [Plasmodium falciparum Santa Lucia]|uniref:Uncharacterized protein n=1 Tax=Plasmodium falciparum Santa Lucia TaxID=478859 RepID=W7F8Y2_PLAFA|nr:hypothetical protein PFAG_06134 [Plasmodium falciparum Santa Lucia]